MDDDFLASTILDMNDEELEAFYEALKEDDKRKEDK